LRKETGDVERFDDFFEAECSMTSLLGSVILSPSRGSIAMLCGNREHLDIMSFHAVRGIAAVVVPRFILPLHHRTKEQDVECRTDVVGKAPVIFSAKLFKGRIHQQHEF